LSTPDLAHAANVLHQGGIVAYATESCFGLGCDPTNESTVLRLLGLKQRDVESGLILIATAVEQLSPYVARFPRKALVTWPGPYTWLLEPTPSAPVWITGSHARIAVRVTSHPQAAALCRQAGISIVSTSANRGGESPAESADEVARCFGDQIDYVLPGEIGKLEKPTPITDGVTGKIIRPG
jgi:L-threonylcarbamoyladenylate synthase